MIRFSAGVLAGGRSTRMGRDKAALPFGGGTLLTHQIAKLRALGIDDVMLSGIAEAADGARPVADVFARLGPLGGIHACLEAAEHEAVLFLSVDTPLIPEAALRALMNAHTGGATVLRAGGEMQPLIAVYDRALAPLCAEILRSGQTSVKRLLALQPPRVVDYAGDENLLRGCNTPEEYAALLRLTK